MSRNCNNERMAMILQYVALGSMIIMTGLAASQVLKDAFGTPIIAQGRQVKMTCQPSFAPNRQATVAGQRSYRSLAAGDSRT